MEKQDSKIMDKIRKLLSLGENNKNENEAQAAILKAQELMAEHGIDVVSADEQKIDYAEERCEHRGNREFRKRLSSVIAANFRCKNYFLGGQVIFFGRSGDAKIAREVFEYAYSFAYKESNRVLAQTRREGCPGEGVINSYAVGFIQGLKEKLGEQSVALMIVTPPDVKEKFEDMTKGWKKDKSILKLANGGNYAAFNRGLNDGRAVMNGRRLEAAG
jgi:hypothetical protein